MFWSDAMESLTLELPIEQSAGLSREAEKRGVSVGELLRAVTADFLAKSESFEVASEYLLKKNAEL